MKTVGVMVFMFLVLTALWVRLRRDYISGLSRACALLVCLPMALRITLPGSLPALTIHRLILIVLLMSWMSYRRRQTDRQKIPLSRFFGFWAGVNLLSLIFTSAEFSTSFKYYLDFVFEMFAFYMIVSTSVRDREDAFRILRGVAAGVTIVAVFAVIEKYTRFNPVDQFVPGVIREGSNTRDVLSTYPHRILMGTAMAMGWPVLLALLLGAGQMSARYRWRLWIGIGAVLSACYFAMSRGPWAATVLAAMVLAVLGSLRIRKAIIGVMVVTGLTLLAKPGVLGSISGLVLSTANTESAKGGTFLYRLELWKIAWSEISRSPLRVLVGYGQGAAREGGLEWELSYRQKDVKVTSWDNNFACDLFQTGILGLSATLLLFGGTVLLLFRLWKEADRKSRDVLACLLAGVLVLVFMRTNVFIFAKQLNFMFWSLTASAIAIGSTVRRNEELPAPAEAEASDGLVVSDQPVSG